MDMQGHIDKYSPRLAQATLRRFREMDSTDTLYGRVFGSLNEVEQMFLRCLPKDYIYLFDNGGLTPVDDESFHFSRSVAYVPADDYTLPDTPANPEYFVGTREDGLNGYETPHGEGKFSYANLPFASYNDGWQFLGFSWEDPRMTEDWNAEHFAHLTPFAKGDDDEVVVAPYAIWRKKGE